MRKMSLLLLCASLSFSVMATEVGQELIVNGNFNDELDYWQIKSPPQQKADSGKEKSFITAQNGILRMNATEVYEDGYIYEATANQCVEIGYGKKFRFTAGFSYEILPVNPYQHRINLIWYEKTDCSGGGQFGTYIEPKKIMGKQALQQDNIMPALNAKAVRIEVAQRREQLMVAGEWSQLSLIATQLAKPNQEPTNNLQATYPLNENLLKNAGFDHDAEYWRKYNSFKWNSHDGDSRPGSASITMHSNAGSMGSGALEQCVNIANHRSFSLGASFKVDESSTQTGGGRLRASWFESENCEGSSKTDSRNIDPKPIRGWQQLKIPLLEAPQNANSVAIEVIQSIAGAGDFTAEWDDLYFMAIPDNANVTK